MEDNQEIRGESYERVSGCWFHFAQSIIKFVKKHRGTHMYASEDEFRKIIHCLMALPLLPADRIRDAYKDIVSLISLDDSNRVLLNNTCQHVFRNWINNRNVGPERLSVYGNVSRTNNILESYHAALKRRVQVQHPNIFMFLGHLQRMTLDYMHDLSRVNRGMSIRRQKRRHAVLNDKCIKTCTMRLETKSWNAIQFLKGVSHSMGSHTQSLVANLAELPDDDSHSESDAEDEIVLNVHVNEQNDSETSVSQTNPPNAPIEPQCQVCLLRPSCPRRVLVPCGHAQFCDLCLEVIQQQKLTCPVCRSVISLVITVYN